MDRNCTTTETVFCRIYVALLAEGVDRNLLAVCTILTVVMSPSSRRAWIEIQSNRQGTKKKYVALLAEGVDRNNKPVIITSGYRTSPSSRRAWIEIKMCCKAMLIRRSSPSSRRAWIEIRSGAGARDTLRVALLAEGVDRNSLLASSFGLMPVALLAEGVDRNTALVVRVTRRMPSPSSRRAWIEIT